MQLPISARWIPHFAGETHIFFRLNPPMGMLRRLSSIWIPGQKLRLTKPGGDDEGNKSLPSKGLQKNNKKIIPPPRLSINA